MGYFDGFRKDGRNSYYGGHRHPVFHDISHAYVLSACCVLLVAFAIIVLGNRGKERWATLLRAVVTLHTGIVLLVTIFGQCWQSAGVSTTCFYTKDLKIDADVYVDVGLKSFNVTLKGQVLNHSEIGGIRYNEAFHFDRMTDMERDYWAARSRGMPGVVLYVAEYFRVDSEGLRWQRSIRQAGHLVYILLWSSFTTWLVANILFGFVVFYGTIFTIATGVLMLVASVLYYELQPATELSIHFDDHFMTFSFGWCFWFCTVSGVLTLLWGGASLLFYRCDATRAQMFFLLDTSHLVPEPEKAAASPLKLHERKSLFLDTVGYHNPAFTLQETSSGISLSPSGGSPSVCSRHSRRSSHTIAAPGGHVIDIETAIVAGSSSPRRKISIGSMHRVRADQIFAGSQSSIVAGNWTSASDLEGDGKSCDNISQRSTSSGAGSIS